MGFPTEFFPVLFAIPRMAGYLAHWRESLDDPDTKIMRPQEVSFFFTYFPLGHSRYCFCQFHDIASRWITGIEPCCSLYVTSVPNGHKSWRDTASNPPIHKTVRCGSGRMYLLLLCVISQCNFWWHIWSFRCTPGCGSDTTRCWRSEWYLLRLTGSDRFLSQTLLDGGSLGPGSRASCSMRLSDDSNKLVGSSFKKWRW